MTIRATTRPYKTYEELAGAEGRQIYFRAERFRPSEIFRHVAPDAVVNGVPLPLNDFSTSGISVLTPADARPVGDVGQEVPVALKVGDIVLHRGRGRIRRIEPNSTRAKIAVEFVKGSLDVSGLMARQRDAVLRSELQTLRSEQLANVPMEYRVHCSDTLHFLLKLRAILDDFASAAQNGSTNGVDRELELLDLCEQIVVPEWHRLWHRGNAIARPLMADTQAVKAVKRYTELMLTPAVLSAPICRLAYLKPRGYPGDFELMSQVYDGKVRGESLYDKLLHRLALDVGECIRARMAMIQDVIGESVRARAGAAPVRVTSLGCGPAEEIASYLARADGAPAIRFTLIDQDHDALAHAYGRIYPGVVRLTNGSAVSCLELSFARLLRGDDAFHGMPAQDLIYSTGLIDYLTERRARELVATLYAKLAPGGRLVIGNMRDVSTGTLWPLEFIFDWSVHYRSDKEMLALAEDLPVETPELLMDSTESVYLLSLRKP